MFLSKSDFKVARSCPTKLFYKKNGYPSRLDESPYLRFLADGGYMVEQMAKLIFNDGVEVGFWDQPQKAFEESRRLVEQGDVILFEPTIIFGKLLARIDILVREGNTLKLIEVKSSSVTSDSSGGLNPFRGKKGGIESAWRPYIEDVTFQAHVLGQVFPEFEIHPFLAVIDKAKIATSDLTFDRFKLRQKASSDGRFSAPDVEYLGDLKQLKTNHLLAILDVSAEVEELRPEVVNSAEAYATLIREDGVVRPAPELGQHCKKCEYRTVFDPTKSNGFRECWGKLGSPNPHLLDLYRIDLAGGKNVNLVAELVAEGKAALEDVPTDRLVGEAAVRQRRQLVCHQSGQEWIDPALPALLRSHTAPLYFIDFEASRLAIPYHKGMHPYELAAFQWSCHTLVSVNSTMSHSEWLNDSDAFPNFAFARSLREKIGDHGTVYIWSPYEVSTLREIRRQMDDYGEKDDELKAWLDRMIEPGNPRIVDLCQIAKDHFIHPDMMGSFSIKDVLPAVWKNNPALRKSPDFMKYDQIDIAGNVLSPYDVLPKLPVGEMEEVVKEGTGAMRTYQEMMYGLSVGDLELRGNLKKLLLQYCELDTAAMVVVWRHWIEGGC
jgi:hypothetical protein